MKRFRLKTAATTFTVYVTRKQIDIPTNKNTWRQSRVQTLKSCFRMCIAATVIWRRVQQAIIVP